MDALASMVPMLLILFVLWQASISLATTSADTMETQQKFNKLVSIADYTVKSGAVLREDNIRYPNWIDGNLLTENYAASLKESAGLDALHIGFYPEGSMCVYRLVIVGQEKSIRRLFVCSQ